MFCRQCEQTAGGKGCSVLGVCGKSPETASAQDSLIQVLKGISFYVHNGGLGGNEFDNVVIQGLFTTITNVNFDSENISAEVSKALKLRDKAKALFKGKGIIVPEIVEWLPGDDLTKDIDEDIQSLREILLYGLKGMAAYTDHALILGKSDDIVNAFFHKGLAALTDDRLSASNYVDLIGEFGLTNLRCMEILDEGHTETFGHPTPTSVKLGVKKGPAIIVTGHDLWDLFQLLKQTEDTGINVYTHGEMLPAHGYPKLNEFKHLVGHFGSAWQNQVKEFKGQPAVYVFTTNCIQKPDESYSENVFTTGLVRYPGIKHVEDKEGGKDFSNVIERAFELDGFISDDIEKEITVGFAHNAVLGKAEKIVEAVKKRDIRHFFLIGGCDGTKFGRNYYTELAEKIPKDCVILTLACGKFRINRLDLGSIGEFPRLLDLGQCNDAYSAIKIASELAKAFNLDINDLPLSLVLSWYEQKAVCVLLTLFALGVKDIRLGPSLPAFISPNVWNILVEKFNVKAITTPDEDLKSMLE